ncbi:MAG: molecular chaperone DnaJ [Deltaproteobacteria bacterium]|nr:molecular chaperone DnaJ [Deltaproteobacteria bacterium]
MAKKKHEEKASGSQESGAPELTAAWAALDRGDVRTARRDAKAVLAGSASDGVKAEARDVLSRTGLELGIRLTLAGMLVAVIVIVIALASR